MTHESPRRARLHVRVSGRVQGVGFRYFVHRAADGLGVTGWVRNVGGSEVEAVAEGPPDALERLAAAIRSGPPAARVDGASVAWHDATGEFDRFEVRVDGLP